MLDGELGAAKAVTFKVKASNDAHIGFFSAAGDAAEVYEVVLSGWGNTQSVIRQRKGGANQFVAPTPGLLSGDEHRPFWASALGGSITVGRGSTVGEDVLMR